MRPAVIIAMDAPLKGAGTSATANRSRNEANNIKTSENPGLHQNHRQLIQQNCVVRLY